MNKKIDPKNTGNSNAGGAPKPINKSMILYLILGIAIIGIIFTTILSPKIKEKKDRTVSINTRDPNLEQYMRDQSPEELEEEIPQEESTFVADPLPHFEKEHEEEPLIITSTSTKPPLKPQTPPSNAFIPNFDKKAARSGIAVNVNKSASSDALTALSSIGNTSQITSTLTSPSTLYRPASGIPSGPTPYDLYAQANAQDQKQEFSESSETGGVTEILSPYALAPGTVIPAALVTGLNTDLPGYIMAQVTQNVYDYTTGKNLLIPAGSRLLAEYNSVVTFGQQRAQIGWSKLIRPDGISIALANSPGIDKLGASGIEGQVNTHLGEILGSIGISALTTFLTGIATNTINNLLSSGAISATLEEVVAQLGDIGYELAERWLNVQPTISLDPGAKVNVLVVQTLTLPPAEPAGTVQKYIRSK